MLTGAIAYQVLEKDAPQIVSRVLTLLEAHPDFDTHWAPLLDNLDQAKTSKAQLLFMLAARWSDDIRGNAKYHQPTWHFIDYPYVPPGTSSEIKGRVPRSENLLTAFKESAARVSNAGNAFPERAVALCWIFHLTGDAHQPLHATSMFSAQFPGGDFGGNRQFLRITENGKPIDLHSFWDGAVIGSTRFQVVRNQATRLRFKYPKEKLPEVSVINPEIWTQESFEAAKEYAYRDGKLVTSTSTVNAPVMDVSYREKAQAVAEYRITLAGYRLAEKLKELLEQR